MCFMKSQPWGLHPQSKKHRTSLRLTGSQKQRRTTITTVRSYGISLDNIPDLVKDPNVDVIYVATPHSHHYNNVKSALNAGKHVLCEKPFTGAKMFPRNNFADGSKRKAGQDSR